MARCGDLINESWVPGCWYAHHLLDLIPESYKTLQKIMEHYETKEIREH